ncbi:hypothetical protein Tco_0739859 [Tanacetum coccineum]
MANEHIPSSATTRSDDQILLFNAWVPIGKGNHVLDLQKKKRNPILIYLWRLCITQTSSELSLHQPMFLPALQRQLKQHQHFHHHHLHYNNQYFIEIFGRSRRDLPRDNSLVSVEVLRNDYKRSNMNKAIVRTEMELVLEHTQQVMEIWFKEISRSTGFIGQFCDADLEVAFQISTCFVRDLQGNDLLTGNHGFDLFTISLQETTSSTPIYFMAKASQLKHGTSSVKKSSSVTNNSKQQDTSPTTNIQSTLEPTAPTNFIAEENNDNQAEDTQFQQNEFINPFCTPVREVAESSSRNIDNSNMHTFYQQHDSEYRWTKDHPLEQVIGNSSKQVQTR